MFVLRLISKLPLGFLYVISDLIFVITFYLLRYRRKVVMANLGNSFPQKSQKELSQIEKAFYRNLCDYAAETIGLLSISKKELAERVVFTNPEAMAEFTGKNQSVLLLASHQFNWEYLLVGGSLFLPAPVDFVYLPQRSKLANAFALAIRTRFGAYPIARESVGREAIKRKHIIRGTAIVADQFPGHFNHRKYWTIFLNQRTAFFYGISQLAILQNAPAFFSKVIKTSRGHYEVTLVKLSTPPYTEASSLAIIDEYVKENEKLINLQPEGWLWSHRRWKNLE